MIKLRISYENEKEKLNILKILSNESIIQKVSKEYTKGKYYQIYVDLTT